jgi:hypothetical protein
MMTATFPTAQGTLTKRHKPSDVRFQLVQVGNARVPVVNARTQLSYQTRQAISQMHSGAFYDHDLWYPPPLLRGELEHTGIYRCCDAVQCTMARTELSEIQTGKSFRTRFLFYMHGDCTHVGSGANQNNLCGQWLWATGRVINVSNPFAVEEIYGSTTIETAFTAALDTPLIAASWSKYRYGNPPAKFPETVIYVDELEQNISEDPTQSAARWWIPCDPPLQFEWQRFYMRDLLAPVTIFDLTQVSNWEADAQYDFTALQTRNVYVDGNTVPRTRWLTSWTVGTANARINVTNRLGFRQYSFANIPGITPYLQYRDNWLGAAYEYFAGPTYQPTADASVAPLLAPGDNLIEVIDQPVTLGVHYAWIN